jgi:hypothetical protein
MTIKQTNKQGTYQGTKESKSGGTTRREQRKMVWDVSDKSGKTMGKTGTQQSTTQQDSLTYKHDNQTNKQGTYQGTKESKSGGTTRREQRKMVQDVSDKSGKTMGKTGTQQSTTQQDELTYDTDTRQRRRRRVVVVGGGSGNERRRRVVPRRHGGHASTL